jgi:hypothetical protein
VHLSGERFQLLESGVHDSIIEQMGDLSIIRRQGVCPKIGW